MYIHIMARYFIALTVKCRLSVPISGVVTDVDILMSVICVAHMQMDKCLCGD